MSSYVISWRTSSLPSPLVYLCSSSSTFRRWSITTPLSFTSNRGPSSGSKPSPTRTTMSSPTHASGIGLSATGLLPRLLSPRILPLLPSLLPVRETLSALLEIKVVGNTSYNTQSSFTSTTRGSLEKPKEQG